VVGIKGWADPMIVMWAQIHIYETESGTLSFGSEFKMSPPANHVPLGVIAWRQVYDYCERIRCATVETFESAF
jgi:hypothetical protein